MDNQNDITETIVTKISTKFTFKSVDFTRYCKSAEKGSFALISVCELCPTQIISPSLVAVTGVFFFTLVLPISTAAAKSTQFFKHTIIRLQ